MTQVAPRQSLMKFVKRVKVNELGPYLIKLPLNLINDSEWMGKPAGSCKIGSFEQENPVSDGEIATITLTIVCKPSGYISHVNNTRYDGYKLIGVTDPVTGEFEEAARPYDIYKEDDFSQYDFGDYRGEFYND